MSFELPLFSPASFTAGAAFTGKQFTVVKLNGTDQQLIPCDTAGEDAFAIIQDEALVGEETNPMLAGISKLKVGTGGLSVNDYWMTDANGDGVLATATNQALGKVVSGGAIGEYAAVTIGLHRKSL